MAELLFAQDSYKLVGICMEVHTNPGLGFKEIIYKDALEYEFKKNNISFIREKRFEIVYKGFVLPHSYNADFIINNAIVLEVKAMPFIVDSFVKQTLNYLKVSETAMNHS